jgi:aspartate kinase
MKFGGTSLGDRERIDTVVDLIRRRLPEDPVVVCSAHAGVTDLLLDGARAAAAGAPDMGPLRAREAELLAALALPADLVDPELEAVEQMFQGLSLLPAGLAPPVLDQIAGFGERMSVKALAAFLRGQGIAATAVEADKAGLLTDGRHGRAAPLPEAYAALEASIAAVEGVPIVTGFIGRGPDGSVTTLGRSGSDFTATIVGRALRAQAVEIWTDVSGVLTADPRVVPGARPVEALTYAEASELAYYGAKVIHPATIQPAVELDIPVRIKNTMAPDAVGTTIGPARGEREVASIASKTGIHLVSITSGRMLGQSGFVSRVFDAFREHDVVVDLIATSEVSITVSVDEEEGLAAVVEDLSSFSTVHVDKGNALIAVIGERMRRATGLTGRVLSAIGAAKIPVRAISYGATKTNLQLVVPADRYADAVRTLHDALFDSE